MRRNILSFQQGSHETFHEAWERLRGYTRNCPHHRFTREAILSHFYWGVAKEQKWTLDVASKGSFLNLTIEEGELLVDNLSRSEESYNESHDPIPKESLYEDFKWTALQDKLDRWEKLLSVQERGLCLDLEQHQEEANFVVQNGNSNQKSMSLNHWSNHGVQGIQQSYQENHEPSQISNNASVEVLSSFGNGMVWTWGWRSVFIGVQEAAWLLGTSYDMIMEEVARNLDQEAAGELEAEEAA
ncbi:unnamed protein product [Microthlaspi erraticum]|uniref:Retrotransposon gag domain-containing protein n=1 Tax=Microthlaspi erraticum TaxID=1685480 RepID=A0A6D2HZU1_9BRAS|nr:unnamed protein product [Microthlaspi erraticum]